MSTVIPTLTEAGFSFLVAGPKFRLLLPSDFEPVPSLSSPLRFGKGGRSFDFVPAHRDRGVTEEHRMPGTLKDRVGRSVELYERLGQPPQWYLRWLLGAGALYTHLREEDGVDMAEPIVAALDIVEGDSAGTPFLLLNPPLKSAVLAWPGYQEFATFRSPVRPGWAVVLQRPSFLSPGQTMVAPGGEAGGDVILRAGANYGMEVQVVSGTDLLGGEELLNTVLDSLAEV